MGMGVRSFIEIYVLIIFSSIFFGKFWGIMEYSEKNYGFNNIEVLFNDIL